MHPLGVVVEHVRKISQEFDVDIDVEKPPEGIDADIALPVGFKLAKILGKKPAECARLFARRIRHPYIERAESVGGYVNISLQRTSFSSAVIRSATSGELWTFPRKNARVVIDYSSPNVAKPMHVGHLRSTVIGEALKRIYAVLGYDTYGINYLGDVGTQFGKLLYALRWADRKRLEEDPIRELLRVYVKFHKEAEKHPELEEEARRIYAELERGNKEYVRLWKWIRELSIKGFERIYRMLGVTFDEISGESFYIERAKQLARHLVEKGIAYVDEDGSIVVDLEEYGLGKDVLLKKDGSTLYLSRDLAALMDRVERLNPEKLLYVVGSEQKMHFKRLFKLAEALGVNKELVHVAFGLINLPEGKISTRKGRVIFLEDVLEKAITLAKEEMERRGGVDEADARKIGIGAVVYSIMKVEPEKTVEFDWNRVLSFEGETGPYIQYAAVRARKILEKAGEYTYTEKEHINEEEWRIVMDLAWYPTVLERAGRLYTPHIVARYAYNLARDFHNFYEKHRVIGAPEPEQSFRLGLVDAFYRTITHAMHLILMEVPGKM